MVVKYGADAESVKAKGEHCCRGTQQETSTLM